MANHTSCSDCNDRLCPGPNHDPPAPRILMRDYVQQAVSRVLTAKPGENFSVRVPIGQGFTQAMILSCAGAARPLIITRLSKYTSDEVAAMHRGKGRPIPEPLKMPPYVRILHPLSCTSEQLGSYKPDRIIIADRPKRAGLKWARALAAYLKWTHTLATYVGPHALVTVVSFEH